MTTLTQVYRFGTSGYRTEDSTNGFTAPIVQQIVNAMADYWLSSQPAQPAVVVSYDRRPISGERAPQVAQWLTQRGFDVYMTEADTPIPLAAFAAQYPEACGIPLVLGAVYVGASHNPPEHAGINVLSAEGAVMASSETAQIEAFQQNPLPMATDIKPGRVIVFDPFDGYYRHLTNELHLDLAAIQQADLALFYDPLYATGRHVFPRLCQQAGISLTVIHGEDDIPADWVGQPNPTAAQLAALSAIMQHAAPNNGLALGLANDGDADRFGVLDETGQFVPTNDVLLLALYSLVTHKLTDKPYALVRSQASSHALDELAGQHHWPVIQTPVGYKYVAETFIEHNHPGKLPVGLGAEASGGLSIYGHIPEKDGLLANLLIAELVATTRTPLTQLVTRIRQRLACAYHFEEFALRTDAGDTLLRHLLALTEQPDATLGTFTVDFAKTSQAALALQSQFGTRDGVKLYFTNQSWLLFRKSGTEPLVRFVLEAVGPDAASAQAHWSNLKTALSQFCQQTVGVTV